MTSTNSTLLAEKYAASNMFDFLDDGYWDYYNEDYEWDDSKELCKSSQDLTRNKLQAEGLSESEAQQYVESGFVYNKTSNSIIDRYYGGLILPTDCKTRFRPNEIGNWPIEPKNRVWVKKANSWNDVNRIVDKAVLESRKRILFRGQGENFPVRRPLSNPWFVVPKLGEVSLIPSLWRTMLDKRNDRFPSFRTLSLFEWSQILLSGFDLEDISKRHQFKIESEGWPPMTQMTEMATMEECDDPVLADFGRFRLDLTMGLKHNLSTLLTTLLQHYGLMSPVLDLTSSLEVAKFFATHKFSRTVSCCKYDFIGTNFRKSVIYLLREDHREMQAHESENSVVTKLSPLRPQRQHCVISRSAPYALNLPADFLIGVIQLDFDSDENECNLKYQDLMPDDADDHFLKALKSFGPTRDRITDFSC